MEILQQESKIGFQSLRFDIKRIPDTEVIERGLYNSLADSTGAIREMCSHILNAGGKRVRPLLVLYSGLVFSEVNEELIHASVAAELIHMASLVHDDIIDHADIRRNRPSINKIWGNQFAVLCGDYLFAKAFGSLAGNRLIKSMDFMVEAIENMCHGEILQADDKFNYGVTLKKYYERIAKKTAIFLKCCCKSGAAAVGAGEVEVHILGQYGLNLGYAFQIIDDIMDFCGNCETMGKPKYEDLSQGNITLPVILLLNDKRYGDWVRAMIINRDFNDVTTGELINVMNESGSIGRSFKIALSHIQKAKYYLRLLPQSQSTMFLDSLADMLQARVN
ncbi:MAG: polyprenyl synthetase family protein [Clostridia bacterium]|nr:polyprenyl synthetase family protein [Clostridia bacterium]